VKSSRAANIATVTPSDETEPSLGHLLVELREQAQNSDKQRHLVCAQTLVTHAVRKYWATLSPGLALKEPPRSTPINVSEPLRMAAARFGESAAKEPVAQAAYHLSLLYAGLLPPDWRAQHGIYYTPPAVAERLLDQADRAGADWGKAHILDPAAGAGAFLVPAVERVLDSLGNCVPALAVQNINARLRGFELDAFAAWLAEVFVEVAALTVVATSGRRIGNIIEVRDSLDDSIQGGRFDLVVGNPPFGKLRLSADRRARFSRSLYGHANLYGVFTDMAIHQARAGGLVSFLTPSSFLAGEYFKNLRRLLGREAPPIEIDFVALRKGVFEDVLQETVLATYRKGGVRQKTRVNFIHPQPNHIIQPETAGHFTLPSDPSAAWLLPRHSDEARLVKRMRAMPERLADWGYKVSTGPLVWNRHKPQLSDTPDKSTVPLIWAECVTRTGRFVFRWAKRNHKPFFRIGESDAWLLVRTPCVLLQRTTAKEQARRLIAAEMPNSFIAKYGAVTVENHLNMLIPTGARPIIPPALLSAFLNSLAADRAFRCLSGSVAVSAYELESLPLPSATAFKKRADLCTTQAGIDGIAAALYGVAAPDGGTTPDAGTAATSRGFNRRTIPRRETGHR
jgi:adenine-specific DNA-methyltransferase